MSSDLRVKLKSFLGTSNSPEPVDENENYWKLIGRTGKVINEVSGEEKLLVLFDDDLNEMGLENHNPTSNSLMINKSDLQYLTD